MARVLRQEQGLRHARGRHRGITPQAVTHRFRQALRAFVAAPRSLRLGDADLVLLIDGVWLQFRGCPWVLYLVALKPVHADAAVFLDPVLLPGREDLTHWTEVWRTCPSPSTLGFGPSWLMICGALSLSPLNGAGCCSCVTSIW